MKKLQEKRTELETKLKRLEDTHFKKGYWSSESAYQDSCKDMEEVYTKLFDVCLELGDPIPVRF